MARTSPISQRRRPDQLRPIRITRGFTPQAAGSVLYESGQTRVLCTASFVKDLPKWRQELGEGWLTAEYGMLPASTAQRKPRPQAGATDGRGTEIQRLIGRVLRSVVNLKKLGPHTVYLDCDVLQADGGTRTAAINGAYIALVDAVSHGLKQGWLGESPLLRPVAAVSVGIVEGQAWLDLDYSLDSRAEVDMNIAMTGDGCFVEIQGAAEKTPFKPSQLTRMLTLARQGIRSILAEQEKALKKRLTRPSSN